MEVAERARMVDMGRKSEGERGIEGERRISVRNKL
jgi:hypothetical protein